MNSTASHKMQLERNNSTKALTILAVNFYAPIIKLFPCFSFSELIVAYIMKFKTSQFKHLYISTNIKRPTYSKIE